MAITLGSTAATQGVDFSTTVSGAVGTPSLVNGADGVFSFDGTKLTARGDRLTPGTLKVAFDDFTTTNGVPAHTAVAFDITVARASAAAPVSITVPPTVAGASVSVAPAGSNLPSGTVFQLLDARGGNTIDPTALGLTFDKTTGALSGTLAAGAGLFDVVVVGKKGVTEVARSRRFSAYNDPKYTPILAPVGGPIYVPPVVVTPTLSLSPISPSIASTAAAGTLISNIANVPVGATPTVTPNDGRLVIAGDSSTGWKIVVGMTALSAGQIDFSVAASGANGASGVLTLTAAGAALTISGTQSTATVGDTTAFTPTIAGGTAPYTLSLASGTMAPGRGISGLSVTGTFTTAGTYSYTLRVTDSVGATATLAVGPLVVSAASAIPLRTVAVQNRMHTGKESQSTPDRQVHRWPLVIATDASELVLWYSNWVHIGTPGPNGAALELLGASLQKDGATSTVPVTFSGARNLVLPDGANDLKSDSIPASAFGLSKFSAGEVYWIKGLLAFAVGSTVPNSQRATSNLTGSQAAFFNSANTTITSIDSPGTSVATGTALSSRSNGYCPLLLGRPLVDVPSYIGIGDSIMDITGDGAVGTNKEYGLAFFQRAMHDADTARTNLRPSINVSRVGIAASGVAASDYWKPLLKYVRFAIEELGTNDMGTGGGASVSSIQANLQSIWSACAAAGVPVYRTNYIARTTSTNQWADKAGQTPSPGWAAGQTRDQLVSWFDTKVADGTLRGVIDTQGAATDPTDNHYFLSTGVASATTVDGTHPQDFIHEAMAAKVRAVIQSLT